MKKKLKNSYRQLSLESIKLKWRYFFSLLQEADYFIKNLLNKLEYLFEGTIDEIAKDILNQDI
jgi:hypothetical protein